MRRHVGEDAQEVGEETQEHHDRPRIHQLLRLSGKLSIMRCCTILLAAVAVCAMLHFSTHPPTQVSRTAELFSTEETKEKTDDVTWDDIEIVSFKHRGTISTGFKARIRGREGLYILKVTGDRRLHWSDTELQMFEILNAPPTIPNIPKLELAINSMPNPLRNRTYLTKTLGMHEERAIYFLLECENISVMVMEYLSGSRLPSTIPELRIFLRSLLTTFSFVHSRNVMMCDLHKHNLHFDGTTVKLFDWNAGFIYKPNSVKIHYKQAPKQLFPPEAWHNESAVHATVSAFDIWSTGLMIIELLKEEIDKHSMDRKTYELVKDFTKAAMTKDPYKRPDANELLQHPFLKETVEISGT